MKKDNFSKQNASAINVRGIYYLAIMVSVFLFSCKKIVDIDPPINSLTTEAVFSDDKGATAAVQALYSEMAFGNRFQMSFAAGSVALLGGMTSDELKPVTPDDERLQFQFNGIFKNNVLNADLWQKAYFYLFKVNTCIEGLEASKNVSSKNQLLGECKFLRAFILFYLTNLYGDVAMPLTTDWRINSTIPRMGQAKVYEQILLDLKQAESLLSNDYPDVERIRVNKFTATALLARVYLYTSDWVNAETSATTVINSGMYQLETDLSKVFVNDSREILFELKPVTSGPRTATLGNIFVDYLPNSYYLTDEFLNAIEPADYRKTEWIREMADDQRTYMVPQKYRRGLVSIFGTTTEYNVVLRLAELFLIRAESRANQNNLTEAIGDLDVIRLRAGLNPLSTSLNKDQILSAVAQERRIELMAEWGDRWLDLKRTGRADGILAPLKQDWQETDKLYPIPESEILLNPALVQNPGYN